MQLTAEVVQRRDAAGIDPTVAKEVAALARAEDLYLPHDVTDQAVVRFFGPPLSRTPSRVVYPLTLWPDHTYEWDLDGGGRVIGGGFHRRDAEGHSLTSRAELRCWYHTAADVRTLLGEPEVSDGWWPEETYSYPVDRETKYLELTFDHGLLTAITTTQRGNAP
jgi:hypothetical protein